MKRFTSKAVNHLVTEKIIKLVDERYIITLKGRDFRRKFLRDTKIDLADQVEILNKDLQNFSTKKIDPENLKQLVKDGFFTEEQLFDIKYCVDRKQPINMGLTRIQADKLMEIMNSL